MHEAGHAVIAHFHGPRRVEWVTLEPNEARQAHVAFLAWPEGVCPEVSIHAEALVTCAGSVAQAHAQTAYELADDLGDQIDLWESAARLAPLDDVEQRRLVAAWFDQCHELVEQHWDAIKAVAQRLHARGKLTGDELEEMLGARPAV